MTNPHKIFLSDLWILFKRGGFKSVRMYLRICKND